MSFRAALRTARPRSALPVPRSQVRFSSSHSNYKNQTQNGIVFGSAAVVGLFAWTGIIFSVGRPTKKDAHHVPTTLPSVATSTSLATSPSISEPLSASSTAPSEPASSDAPQSQSAAFNPETGEINWDCPCLGGMAHGPCGEEFKAAFSCFVYSDAEPQGVDCVEKFRGMQECFRKHPDVYGSDVDADDDDFELLEKVEAALSTPDEEFLKEVEVSAALE
ncbi:mitochondrial intermembrane space import and assembly protein [Pseudohyphozyma bogoriensis]|nr:mitochondrial intermembrane space import and assembly protein [Pseudohyphozyma bogoriensis]